MEKKIYLVSIGKNYEGVVEYLKENLKIVYPFEFVPKEIDLEIESAFNPIRRQYLSQLILLRLKKEKPEDAFMILGIFNKDLYTDNLNFIFGQAEPSSGIGIISIYRLREEFYNRMENKELLRIRALKEAVHEIGHLFGLPHCLSPTCVMYFSNSIIDTDKKSFKLCISCERKLKSVLKTLK